MGSEVLPLYRVHLTAEQHGELKRRCHAADVKPRTRDRLEMVRLADAGHSIPQIAALLRISEVRVRYWVKRFLTLGFDALVDQPHLGQPSQLTPALLAAIQTELAKGDRTWTARQLAEWLAAQHGVEFSPDWLGEKLGRARLSYKRTTRSLQHKQNQALVAERRADLETLEKGEPLVAWTSATSTKQASLPLNPPATVGGRSENAAGSPTKPHRDGG
jgi:transposase